MDRMSSSVPFSPVDPQRFAGFARMVASAGRALAGLCSSVAAGASRIFSQMRPASVGVGRPLAARGAEAIQASQARQIAGPTSPGLQTEDFRRRDTKAGGPERLYRDDYIPASADEALEVTRTYLSKLPPAAIHGEKLLRANDTAHGETALSRFTKDRSNPTFARIAQEVIQTARNEATLRGLDGMTGAAAQLERERILAQVLATVVPQRLGELPQEVRDLLTDVADFTQAQRDAEPAPAPDGKADAATKPDRLNARQRVISNIVILRGLSPFFTDVYATRRLPNGTAIAEQDRHWYLSAGHVLQSLGAGSGVNSKAIPTSPDPKVSAALAKEKVNLKTQTQVIAGPMLKAMEAAVMTRPPATPVVGAQGPATDPSR